MHDRRYRDNNHLSFRDLQDWDILPPHWISTLYSAESLLLTMARTRIHTNTRLLDVARLDFDLWICIMNAIYLIFVLISSASAAVETEYNCSLGSKFSVSNFNYSYFYKNVNSEIMDFRRDPSTFIFRGLCWWSDPVYEQRSAWS